MDAKMTAIMSTFEAYQALPVPPSPSIDGGWGETRNNLNDLLEMEKPGDLPRAIKSAKCDAAPGLKYDIIPLGHRYKRQSIPGTPMRAGKGRGGGPRPAAKDPIGS